MVSGSATSSMLSLFCSALLFSSSVFAGDNEKFNNNVRRSRSHVMREGVSLDAQRRSVATPAAAAHQDRSPLLDSRKHHNMHRRRAAGMSNAANKTVTTEKKRGGYHLTDSFAGDSFFDQWDFYGDSGSETDPTQGNVRYVTRNEAMNSKMALAYVTNNQAIMKVDAWSQLAWGAPRASVRISSKKRYNSGLFILDLAHMPEGDATWPAFWTVNVDGWPASGEIDIIEGVNLNTKNQMTLHTNQGCSLDSSLVNSLAAVSTPASWNCASTQDSNNGCAFVDNDGASYGSALNAAGGGVFAMEWTQTGIKIWHFPRSAIPADITSGNPNPYGSGWNQYLKAAWSSSTCNIDGLFNNHQIVFDTTLCGDWAGGAFSGGASACTASVQNPGNFGNAYWAVNSLSVYQY